MGIIQDQDAYILAWDYGFMPFDDAKYEQYHLQDDLFWSKLAKDPPNSSVLVKFNADDLVHE